MNQSDTISADDSGAQDSVEGDLADFKLVPYHEFAAPLRSACEDAEAALEAAQIAEAAADEAVTVARGDFGLNLIARGALLKKQRHLAQCIEARIQAEAVLIARQRHEDKAIEGRRVAEGLIKRDQAKRRDAIVAASTARRSELLAQALDVLEAADDLPELPRMERVSHRWTEILWRLREVSQAHGITATKGRVP